jgi:hypothetical protein
MKGIVFCEFISMVEEYFSLDIADRIIASSELATGGAYTSAGTYDHREFVQLITRLSEETKVPVPDLVCTFGRHLCKRFAMLYPSFFAECQSTFEFLASVDGKIHVEVRKLYPDAQLPEFAHAFPEPGCMVFTYRSKQPLADLAEGLIQGAIAHYGEKINLTRDNLPCADGAHVRFTLKRNMS